jgi:putative FmdB family regulatory protein
MPLYEYKCDRCGDVFEVMQKFSDAPLVEHQGCGGHVERLLSAPALQFKGTGWYVTDYARNSSNGRSPASSSKKDSDAGTAKKESSNSSQPSTSPTTEKK